MRLLAVLGYSARRPNGLHPICAARLRHAETLGANADAVVFSGWSRSSVHHGEAELMRQAWAGPDVPLVCETTARNTAENAAGIAAIARRLRADEIVVVTSRWHAPRARLLVRAALRGTRIAVRLSAPRDRLHPWLIAREAACTLALPLHLRRSRADRG
jgi:uncharacterized SAM-binding protein YcdF (DUF218 family)